DMGAFESQYTVGIDPLSILPLTFSLNPAYPNPFNPSTTISYSVETNGRLSLQIYDIAGRLVETLVNGITEPGIYTVKWDASGYSSGVYFVQIQTKKFVKTQKLILLK
ncbi:MAG: T9SS type A sorting domain-containing protein, partial [Candidatus Marinimicrobia bacterium]|nr:T9SS type A sorting domain-containing protein [Candidatus Neomarinimicrobiota bacterium]